MVVKSFFYGKTLTDLEKLCINSFLKNGFGYELYVYKDLIPDGIPNGVRIENANSIVPRNKLFRYKTGFNRGSVSGFANLFRYVLLYKKGGVWVDTDICLVGGSLGFEKENVFIFEEGTDLKNNWLANSLFRVEANSPIMKKCIDVFKKKNLDRIVHGETGPKLLTKVLRGYKDTIRRNSDVILKKSDNYFPIHHENTKRLFYDDIEFDESVKTVHFWNACVNDCGIDKNGEFPYWSIYEKLKSKYL